MAKKTTKEIKREVCGDIQDIIANQLKDLEEQYQKAFEEHDFNEMCVIIRQKCCLLQLTNSIVDLKWVKYGSEEDEDETI